MNMIERLISGYPQGDVSPQDFIDHLSMGADGWMGAWVAVGLAVIFGMLVYIIPIYLTEKDKVGPYPLWLHTFYCAADIMGVVCLFFSIRGLVQYIHLPIKNPK